MQTQKISNEFINKYIQIFDSKREWSKGPGTWTKDSPSIYGLQKTINDKAEHKNLWDKLVAFDPIKSIENPDEKFRCAVNGSPTVELFKFLDALNNLRINKESYLTKDQKIKIINNLVLKAKSLTLPIF